MKLGARQSVGASGASESEETLPRSTRSDAPTLRRSHALLATLLCICIITGWQGGFAASSHDPATRVRNCDCCKAERGDCATQACCETPAQNRVPVAPALPSSSHDNQQHAIAPIYFALSTVPHSTLRNSLPATAVFNTRAVPIFQRGCSFLI